MGKKKTGPQLKIDVYNPPGGFVAKRLDFLGLEQFYNSRPKDNPANDGTLEYKIAVIKACGETCPEKDIDPKSIGSFFDIAINKNPILSHHYRSFELREIKERFNEEEGSPSYGAVIPYYDDEEIIEILFKTRKCHEPDSRFLSLWIGPLVYNSMLLSSQINIDEDSWYNEIVQLNPGLSYVNAIKFEERLKSDPSLELRYNRSSTGEIQLPELLSKLAYVRRPGYDHKRISIRPDLEEIFSEDLEYMTNWPVYRENGISPLKHRLFLGKHGAGKTTGIITFAERVCDELPDVPVLDLGRLREVFEEVDSHSVASTFEEIRQYLTATNSVCLGLWDDIAELLNVNFTRDMQRDQLVTTLKNVIGGTYSIPGFLIYGTGNGNREEINPAFLTDKRFGTPIEMKEDQQQKKRVLLKQFNHFKFVYDAKSVEEILGYLPSGMSVEDIVSAVERERIRAIKEKDSPTFTGFLMESLNHVLSKSLGNSEENGQRASYMAGIATVAISLNLLPLAAAIDESSKTKLPQILFSNGKITLSSALKRFLSYCGGLSVFETENIKVEYSETYLYATGYASAELSSLVESGVSAYGVDMMPNLRNEPEKNEAITVPTLKQGLAVARDILKKNQEIYTMIKTYFQDNSRAFYSDFAGWSKDERLHASQIEAKYDTGTPELYIKSCPNQHGFLLERQ